MKQNHEPENPNHAPTTPPDGITVRLAQRDDAQALVQFNQAMAWETEGKGLGAETLMAGVVAVFDHPQRGFYVVAVDHQAAKPVGGLLITFEWSDWRNGNFWWIQSVYIAPPYRRRGIYSGLYDFVVHQARGDPNACGFRLYVEQDNAVAQKTYQRLGMAATPYLMYETTVPPLALPPPQLDPEGQQK